MSAGTYNIFVEQGATYSQNFIWTTGTPATPVNVTGYAGRMHIRSSLAAPDTLYQLTTTNGRIVMGGSDGQITLIIPANDSTTFTWTQGVYDLELISTGSTPIVTRLLKGSVSVDPEITKQ